MKVCVIGLGEIGFNLMTDLVEKNIDTIFGVDISDEKINLAKKKGFAAGKKIPLDYEVYVICVLLSDQVLAVVRETNFPKKSLIVIESTTKPGTCLEILKIRPESKVVMFPHRFNANDPEHRFFNLKRVIGAVNKKTLDEALVFYARYMPENLLMPVPLDIAELCKPLENAYRYLQIAFAEELKLLCIEKNIDFEELRKACNSKWNIEIMEARDGIGKHCLPKDINIINNFFKNNTFFKIAVNTDKKYRQYLDSL